MSRCRGKRKDGQPCKMPAGADGYCWAHRQTPGADEARRAARSKGGQVGKAKTLTLEEILSDDPGAISLENTQDARALLARVIEWTLTGRIDPKVANAVVLAVNATLRGLSQDVEEQLEQLRTEIEALKNVRGVA